MARSGPARRSRARTTSLPSSWRAGSESAACCRCFAGPGFASLESERRSLWPRPRARQRRHYPARAGERLPGPRRSRRVASVRLAGGLSRCAAGAGPTVRVGALRGARARHPGRPGRPDPRLRSRERARFSLPGRGQDRHQPALHRQLGGGDDRRLHRRRVGRQLQRQADGWRERRERRRSAPASRRAGDGAAVSGRIAARPSLHRSRGGVGLPSLGCPPRPCLPHGDGVVRAGARSRPTPAAGTTRTVECGFRPSTRSGWSSRRCRGPHASVTGTSRRLEPRPRRRVPHRLTGRRRRLPAAARGREPLCHRRTARGGQPSRCRRALDSRRRSPPAGRAGRCRTGGTGCGRSRPRAIRRRWPSRSNDGATLGRAGSRPAIAATGGPGCTRR